MKTWKLTLLSFVAGMVLAVAPIVTHACASMIWLQSADSCNAYDRYNLVSSSSGGGVEVCYYQKSGGSQHIESGHCDELPYLM